MNGVDITIQDVFEAVGAHAAGKITDEQLLEIEDPRLPGGRGLRRAIYSQHHGYRDGGHRHFPQWALLASRRSILGKTMQAIKRAFVLMEALKANLRPRDIMNRKAFENAVASVAATGGSTNAVLHLLALARDCDVDLSIDDFDAISERTPLLVDLKPGGKYVAADVDKAGGIQLIAKRLVEGGYADGSQMTVTGAPLAEASAIAVEDTGPRCHSGT